MFEEHRKKLHELASRKTVSFAELFPPRFMSEHSSFGTMEELFDKSGFKVESMEDFGAIPDEEWETFIVQNTNFDSWEEMQQTAGASFAQEALSV